MKFLEWLVGPEAPGEGKTTHLLPRWIVLRALGLIYFSAFYSYLFQIKGLIGPQGILPASEFLPRVKDALGSVQGVWYAPTLLWFGSSDRALMIVCWLGIAASIAVVVNLWPRMSLFISWLCFLSFVAAGQEFSSYQSDGMLLEAGFISLFFAPPGLRPGLGAAHAPSRFSRFLLQWEWFRIYFGSGVVKLASGDYSWRHLTAMDDYYQNGPLPTWVGWYVQQLPHKFHAATALLTLIAELGIVFMFFLPRRWRIICFFILTPFQIGIILTANYTFLNYLVLVLGFLLLDDGFLRSILPQKWREPARVGGGKTPRGRWHHWLLPTQRVGALAALWWIFYATIVLLLAEFPGGGFAGRTGTILYGPVRALEPFRIANSYGLFAVMTHARYEIEFQGSNDGVTWAPYPFRYKPQDPNRAPGIYAPYQPRFEWNLWFASLGSGRENPWVLETEIRLLTASPPVLELFARNPFPHGPPQRVRAVLWQYWFTDLETKRKTGAWWRRELLDLYALPLERTPEGKIEESPESPEQTR
ncbi:MAG TPA: lipase maturation factor family protein [Candidatus Angelobacter sp.]